MSRFVDYAIKNLYAVEENIEHACTILSLTLEVSADDRYSKDNVVAENFSKTEVALRALKAIHESISDIIWDANILKSREETIHDRFFVFENNELREIPEEEAIKKGLSVSQEERLLKEDNNELIGKTELL